MGCFEKNGRPQLRNGLESLGGAVGKKYCGWLCVALPRQGMLFWRMHSFRTRLLVYGPGVLGIDCGF